MDIDVKLLDLLFCRIPPERILQRLKLRTDPLNFSASNKNEMDTFLRFAETTLHGYSTDEQIQLFNYLKQSATKISDELQIFPSVFTLLAEFGKRILNVGDNSPTCKFEDVLLWRDAYQLLGQDTIICAYMAYHDILNEKIRRYFAWPAIIQTDYVQLNQMLSDGVAENHCHLNGSTQSFGVTWCKLMNHPELSVSWAEQIRLMLTLSVVRGPEDNVKSLNERTILASAARASLYSSVSNYKYGRTSDGIHADDNFLKTFEEHLNPEQSITSKIEALRICYGASIPGPTGITDRLDYALTDEVFLPAADSPYRILSGERCFLYRCFYACFSGYFTPFEHDLFYMYLLIKNACRAEMIQVNRQIGFQNFSDYEKRKDLLYYDDNTYWWEAYRMALNAPLEQEHVISFESRFCPSLTAKALKNKVMKYDKAKWYADIRYSDLSLFTDSDFETMRRSGRLSNEPHFYVLHYPKCKDETIEDSTHNLYICRHEKYRNYLKKTTLALEAALAESDYLSGRIRGVDGCANEVVCRPEVFATAYRYLAIPHYHEHSQGLLQEPVRKVSFTYHAGEDFYDIADGLRAIDETIYFLEFKRGSRIGHALALGIDPDIHYRTKHHYIVLPKQNHLDNLVWLMYRGRELGVHIDSHQYGIMKEFALKLLREIYGQAMADNQWTVDLSEYYSSMKLRGDDPGLYSTGVYQESRPFADQYDRCGISGEHSELEANRMDKKVAGLYYYYHYGIHEKIEGEKPVSMSVTPGYIKVIRDTQDKLQMELERMGVVIECNPTSNVLIGTFGDYGKHPIFRFNDYGLATNLSHSAPQIQVCINTDDLGVFDTSIGFEYALLAKALGDLKDDRGEKIYSSVEIIHYLDNIRKMGSQAVFPKMEKHIF